MIESLKMLDRTLFFKINALHSPLLDEFMWHMSDSWHTVLVVLAVAYAFYKKFTLKKAAEFLLGCALVFACTDFTANLIKHQVQRYRPSHNLEIQHQVHVVKEYRGGQFGFFSAHSANAFGVITFVVLSINWIQLKYKLLIYFYPFLIAYSRVYLGVHYPGDVLAGMCYGIFFAFIIHYIMNKYFIRSHASAA